jgi:cytochrome P450
MQMTTSTGPDQFFNPLNPEHLAAPDELLHATRIGCPVGQVSNILYTVNTDSGVRQVFDDTRHFSNKGNFSVGPEDVQWPFTVATQADPPAHTALRARLMKNFAPARLRKLTPQVESIVRDCLGSLPDSGRVDLYADCAHFIPARVLYALIGIPEAAWSDVQAWADVIVATVPEPTHELPESGSLTSYLGQLVEERRARPGSRQAGVLDNLCFAESGEADMSTPEVMTHILQLGARRDRYDAGAHCQLLVPTARKSAALGGRPSRPLAVAECHRRVAADGLTGTVHGAFGGRGRDHRCVPSSCR